VTSFEFLGVPLEFVLFAATLIGIALFHDRTLQVALIGLASIVLYKLFATGFAGTPGIGGLWHHLAHESVPLANLFGLLVGFALLSRHFEESHIPNLLPRVLPDDWRGGLVLLALVFVLSGFLDNIAAAIIGATVAGVVYRHKLHIGFLAAIVAASNAGGSGSVVGDTTTTMMWIDGVSPGNVLHAYVAAAAAFFVFAIPASIQQQRFSPIVKHGPKHVHIDWARAAIVVAMLVAAIAVNVTVNTQAPEWADRFPWLGAAVWLVLIVCAPIRRPDWQAATVAVKGSLFLLSLVLAASMMPVDRLPAPSWITTLELGFVSAVFDNIPLTKLALDQGGYDWGMLAYAVGFGGSMLWFGSSAGVAVSNLFPQAKSVAAWLRGGWYVGLAYVVGFLVLLAVIGWHPHAPHR
jgi:hypothetical protein